MRSGRYNPWLFLVAAVLAAGTETTVPGNAQGQEPATSLTGARVRVALRDQPGRWLIGAGAGALVGWAVRSDTWEPLSPPHISARRVPTGTTRRAALGLSLEF